MNKTPEANQKTGTRRKSIPRLILGVVLIGVVGGSLSNPQVPMSHDLTEFIVFFAIKLLLVCAQRDIECAPGFVFEQSRIAVAKRI
jgi:hypothetical protein